MGDKLHFLAVQADSGRLIKFRRLLFFVFVQENGVNVIFQRRMLSVVDGRRIRGVVPNAACLLYTSCQGIQYCSWERIR